MLRLTPSLFPVALLVGLIAPAPRPAEADQTIGPLKSFEAAAKQLEAFIAREVAQKDCSPTSR
jgi:hypothetical protein